MVTFIVRLASSVIACRSCAVQASCAHQARAWSNHACTGRLQHVLRWHHHIEGARCKQANLSSWHCLINTKGCLQARTKIQHDCTIRDCSHPEELTPTACAASSVCEPEASPPPDTVGRYDTPSLESFSPSRLTSAGDPTTPNDDINCRHKIPQTVCMTISFYSFCKCSHICISMHILFDFSRIKQAAKSTDLVSNTLAIDP